MANGGQVSAWLLMTVDGNRQHGGNAGYDDQADVYYTWDSTVPNHAQIKPGDPVVVWDKHRLLGISVIEEIHEEAKEKLLFKCPHCGKAGIKSRLTIAPRYKCYKCKGVFETPDTQAATVVEYRSRHDAAWTSLENSLSGDHLRQLCESPKSQLSMRPLRWAPFQEAVSSKGGQRAVDRVTQRAPDFVFPRGHALEMVRVRRGQRQFREHLLEAQGEKCAFTGAAPSRVLEAGHLYSYAELGVHHEHGGLLLRRDIHRLFDDGWLAVDPDTLKVNVSDGLETFPQYASLHDRKLRTRLRHSHVEWLARHWAEHRAS
jgi:predicted RNA-binding Zn-ribbon protein involved in translation (DUF1610 family)